MSRRLKGRLQKGPAMYQVLFCLTYEHDWRLVFLAACVCLLASGVVISLFHRARETTGKSRAGWLPLDAAAAGCGIWATHFIAMLAYDPGVGAGYSLALTLLSLGLASAITGLGMFVALRHSSLLWAPIGGATLGGGIAAMHYTGMMALQVPGRIMWATPTVVASVVLGMMFG